MLTTRCFLERGIFLIVKIILLLNIIIIHDQGRPRRELSLLNSAIVKIAFLFVT